MEIGFIGLGTMGSRMAARLAAAGHQPSVFDNSPLFPRWGSRNRRNHLFEPL